MVVKPGKVIMVLSGLFESRVILDGSQTAVDAISVDNKFESRVILDGSQTLLDIEPDKHQV